MNLIRTARARHNITWHGLSARSVLKCSVLDYVHFLSTDIYFMAMAIEKDVGSPYTAWAPLILGAVKQSCTKKIHLGQRHLHTELCVTTWDKL
jgi:hypothetical protein